VRAVSCWLVFSVVFLCLFPRGVPLRACVLAPFGCDARHLRGSPYPAFPVTPPHVGVVPFRPRPQVGGLAVGGGCLSGRGLLRLNSAWLIILPHFCTYTLGSSVVKKKTAFGRFCNSPFTTICYIFFLLYDVSLLAPGGICYIVCPLSPFSLSFVLILEVLGFRRY